MEHFVECHLPLCPDGQSISIVERDLAAEQYSVAERSLVVELDVEEQELLIGEHQLTKEQDLVVGAHDLAMKYNWAPEQDLVSECNLATEQDLVGEHYLASEQDVVVEHSEQKVESHFDI